MFEYLNLYDPTSTWTIVFYNEDNEIVARAYAHNEEAVHHIAYWYRHHMMYCSKIHAANVTINKDIYYGFKF